MLWSELADSEKAALEAMETASAESAEMRDAPAVLERLLAGLSPDQRALITWLELEQKSIAEVAAMTGWLMRPILAPEAQIAVAHRLPTPSKTIESLDSRLHFTEEQKRALQPIVEEWAKAARAAEMPMRERRYEAFQTAVPRIRAPLTPVQQKEFDEMADRVRSVHEERTKTGTE